jgi:hypothetical protein
MSKVKDSIESYPAVTRIEVIGEGREFVKLDARGIRISLQDDGQTLKVFIDATPAVRGTH